MRERFKEEFQSRYGEGLSDEELRVAAREEMVGRMQAQLKEEGIDVNGVTGVMEEMSKRNRELFKLPPYVLYVSRAFSTLEGIGLSVDGDYSILQQCYPYLSKRLLSDNSPRSKSALKLMLFGGSNSIGAAQGGMFSPAKFIEMSDGLASYTTAVSDADNIEGAKQAQSALADVVLDPNGNYLQELLLEEAAKITDAALRDQFVKLKNSAPGRLVKAALKTPRDIVYRFVPESLRPLALPFSLPYDVASRLVRAAGKDAADEASLQTVSSIWDSVRPQLKSAMMNELGVSDLEAPASPAVAMKGKASSIAPTPKVAAPEQSLAAAAPRALANAARELQKQATDPKSAFRVAVDDPKFRQRLPVIGTLGRKFGAILLERTAERLLSESQNVRMVSEEGIVQVMGSSDGAHKSDETYALVAERLLSLSSSATSTVAQAVSPSQAFVKSDNSVSSD
jgi:hypothetical protein